MSESRTVSVIGAGLAGCEAAYTLARHGIAVTLYEQKPIIKTPAHSYDGFAELVCSNSLKAARIGSAAGLLKAEMRIFGSIILDAADKAQVPAGGALAVDRVKFSDEVTHAIKSHPLIRIVTEETTDTKEGITIIATGPLTSGRLAEKIKKLCGGLLNFYDAAAPIITADSIDWDTAFLASRYGRDEGSVGDYANCPFDGGQYEEFRNALINAETAPLKSFDNAGNYKVYEGCMPIEVLAKRGVDAMRYGPLKPVGIFDNRTGRRPFAVVQLRKEDKEDKLYNLVGFQTNLKFGEQKRVFSMIPGLSRAEFVRFGVMHRNTFIDSPRCLNNDYSIKTPHIPCGDGMPEGGARRLYFAGQITGVEGYIESAASGILAALNVVRLLQGKDKLVLPETTMIGALTKYITDESIRNFQPMGCNMGLLPPIGYKIKIREERYDALAKRALGDLKSEISRQ